MSVTLQCSVGVLHYLITYIGPKASLMNVGLGETKPIYLSNLGATARIYPQNRYFILQQNFELQKTMKPTTNTRIEAILLPENMCPFW